MWSMHSERNVKVFRSERWKNVNEIVVNMEIVYAKTKTSKTAKNFVHFSQFAMQREIILENVNSKSIRLLNHNILVFV